MQVKLTIPEQIMILQKRKNMSSDDMAAILGVAKQNYLRRLRLNNFTSAELEKIAEVFECSIQFSSIAKFE